MNRQSLKTLSALFGWSFLVCVAVQLFALVMLTTLQDVAYDVHSKLFDISRPDFAIASYAFLGAMKTLGLTLFFCPWAATKIAAARLKD